MTSDFNYIYYFFKETTSLLFGSSPILTVSTLLFCCKWLCIIFLSYACIGSNLTGFLVLITVFATFCANSSNVFSLFFFFLSISKITLTFLSIPFPAIADNIFWNAYSVSPLYPIKNPRFLFKISMFLLFCFFYL